MNLQGSGHTDGNFEVHTQLQNNSGFDARGSLKPDYAQRLRQVIEGADELGMMVIVDYFYQGTEARIDPACRVAPSRARIDILWMIAMM